MYGSVFRLRPLPGQEQEVIAAFESWNRERRPRVADFVAAYLYRSMSHPGEYLNAVVFESREAYERNGNDPDQDRWYRGLRAHLASDPEWEDGDVVTSF